MYRCYCECCKCETPHDDIFDFDRIYSHCLNCGYLTFDHLCDDEELEFFYSVTDFLQEEKECDCCNDEIEF